MKTQIFKNRSRFIASVATTVVAATLLSAPVMAQEAPQNADETAEEQGDVIVVTGSRIANPNLQLSSPVKDIGADIIELRQSNTAEEILRDLPGVVANIGSAVNNGNGGAAFADLRGLGTNRNLVLIDSTRLTPAGLNSAFDLNNIPLALVERVDFFTGGATTTYGADAVSGVVNFITKRDFSGIEISASEQLTGRGDGNVFRFDLVLGANLDDGRGNVTLGVGYQESDAVFQGQRDFSINNIDSFTGAAGGSGTTVPTRFSGARLESSGTNPALPNGGTLVIDPATGALVAGFTPFNFNPFNLFNTPFERFNIFATGHYEVNDTVEIYSRALFSKNTVNTIIAPSGTFGSTVTLPLSNPFLTTRTRNQFCAFNTAAAGSGLYTPRFSQAVCDAAATATNPTDPNFREITITAPRRFVEAGTRDSSFTTTIFDYKIGARGDISDTVSWDIFGAYGESQNDRRQTGNGLLSRLRQSVRSTNPTTCINPAGGCVPINLFGPVGSITQEALGFIAGVATGGSTQTSLAQVQGSLTGEFNTGLAQPLSFAVGGEYRRYTASTVSDLATQTPGEVLGNGAASPDVFGGYDVYEGFGEVIQTVLEDVNFAKSLTLEAGARISRYSTAGSAFTWKVGGTWEPLDGLRFRGNYQRGSRAPDVGELFSPLVTGLSNLAIDPCQGNAPVANANLRAICIAQGAPANSIGSINPPSAGQINITTGGNINLEVENATTWTVGATAQPAFVSGLSLSVDYFNILVTEAISTPTVNDVIGACFNNITAASAASVACTSIRRNTLTGGLDGAAELAPGLPFALSNLGRLQTDGIDVAIAYQRDLGFADLDLNFTGTWTNQNRFQATPTSPNRDCVGFFSVNCPFSGSLQPEFSFNQRTSLTLNDKVTFSLLWRYVDSFIYEPLQAIADGGLPPEFERIGAQHYFDLSGRAELTDNVTFTFTVTNLFDNSPPIVGSTAGVTAFNSGNTFPSTFDALGRRFAAGVRFRF